MLRSLFVRDRRPKYTRDVCCTQRSTEERLSEGSREQRRSESAACGRSYPAPPLHRVEDSLQRAEGRQAWAGLLVQLQSDQGLVPTHLHLKHDPVLIWRRARTHTHNGQCGQEILKIQEYMNKGFVRKSTTLCKCMHTHTLKLTLWVFHWFPVLAAVVHAEHKSIQNERHDDGHDHLERTHTQRIRKAHCSVTHIPADAQASPWSRCRRS